MRRRWFSSPDILERNLDAESVAQATARQAKINPAGFRKVVKILKPASNTTGNRQYPRTDATDDSVILLELLINDRRIYINKHDVTAKP